MEWWCKFIWPTASLSYYYYSILSSDIFSSFETSPMTLCLCEHFQSSSSFQTTTRFQRRREFRGLYFLVYIVVPIKTATVPSRGDGALLVYGSCYYCRDERHYTRSLCRYIIFILCVYRIIYDWQCDRRGKRERLVNLDNHTRRRR